MASMELREHRLWRFWMPLALVVIGVVALLANLNLAPGAIYRLLLLWPVIAIFLGAELLIRRFLAGPSALVVSVVVMAALFAGSVAYALFGPTQPASPGALDAAAARQGWLRANLQLDIEAAPVEVSSADLGDDLYRIHIDYPSGGSVPKVKADRESGAVTVQTHSQPWFWPGPSGHDQIRVVLSRAVPWAISLSGAAVSGHLDLSQLNLKEVNLSGGANTVSLHLPAPLGTVSVNVSGDANQVSLRALRSTAASIESSGGANSLTVFGRTAFNGFAKQSWRSDNFESAPDRYRVDISGGANTVAYDETSA